MSLSRASKRRPSSCPARQSGDRQRHGRSRAASNAPLSRAAPDRRASRGTCPDSRIRLRRAARSARRRCRRGCRSRDRPAGAPSAAPARPRNAPSAATGRAARRPSRCPSQRKSSSMPDTNSGRLRPGSRSSMRSRNLPPALRARCQPMRRAIGVAEVQPPGRRRGEAGDQSSAPGASLQRCTSPSPARCPAKP